MVKVNNWTNVVLFCLLRQLFTLNASDKNIRISNLRILKTFDPNNFYGWESVGRKSLFTNLYAKNTDYYYEYDYDLLWKKRAHFR